MELATIVTEKGSINISRITIEALIQLVLQEVNGLIIPKKIKFKKLLQASDGDNVNENTGITPQVRVEIKPDSILVNLFLNIYYGIRIPDLTWEVQAKVKEKIKQVTDLDLDQINVHIQGIHIYKKQQNRSNLVTPGSFLKIF